MKKSRLTTLIVLIGIFVRIGLWMTTPITGDALFHYSISKYIGDTLSIPTFDYQTGPNPFWWPPLFHIISALFYKIGVITLTPLFFGIIGLFAFYIFCKEFFPKNLSTSMILLSFLPFHMYYSSIGYFETLIFFLSITCFHFYFMYVRYKKFQYLLSSLAFAGLAGLTHYHGLIPLIIVTISLFLKKDDKAMVFLVAGLLLISPWYIRNTVIFGNPIWPKVYGGVYPFDSAVQKVPLKQVIQNIGSPKRWMGVFFDFWIGAPNSGEDIADNIRVGKERFPFFIPGMIIWIFSILFFSILSISGLNMLKKKPIFKFITVIFLVSLIPFIVNQLARMFVCLYPFLIIAMAKGFDSIKSNKRFIILLISIVLFTGASTGYSITYRNIRDQYTPFFQQMKTGIPEGVKIVMPYNIQDCVYLTGKMCMRLDGEGGVSRPSRYNIREDLKRQGVEYLCCSSLYWDALSDEDMQLCEFFKPEKPEIEYQNDVWGKCWKL